MTGDSRMFNSINENESNVIDSKARLRVLVRFQYPMT
jgi:hypothetical protein